MSKIVKGALIGGAAGAGVAVIQSYQRDDPPETMAVRAAVQGVGGAAGGALIGWAWSAIEQGQAARLAGQAAGLISAAGDAAGPYAERATRLGREQFGQVAASTGRATAAAVRQATAQQARMAGWTASRQARAQARETAKAAIRKARLEARKTAKVAVRRARWEAKDAAALARLQAKEAARQARMQAWASAQQAAKMAREQALPYVQQAAGQAVGQAAPYVGRATGLAGRLADHDGVATLRPHAAVPA
jgi:vacuolar-type H+-ATPase subunit H